MGFFNTLFSKETLQRSMKVMEEIALEILPEGSNQQNQYIQNGISMRRLGEGVQLSYNGILANHGAQEITVVLGQGSKNQWDTIKELRMQKVNEKTFRTLLPKLQGNFQFAFKDNANHWDNNSGKNYSIFQH